MRARGNGTPKEQEDRIETEKGAGVGEILGAPLRPESEHMLRLASVTSMMQEGAAC